MTESQSLDVLLAHEIERRLGRSDSPIPDLEATKQALHGLKGAAAMAGHPDLALLMTQLGMRVRQGEPDVAATGVELLRRAAQRLSRGQRPFTTRWPVPPEGLIPSQVDAAQRGEYLSIMRDRLSELDAILRESGEETHNLERVYRVAHSLKATAGAFGDDTTAWFCHGMEAKVRAVLRSGRGVETTLLDLGQHRSTLARLLDNPSEAFEMLRATERAAYFRRTTPPWMAASAVHPSSRPASPQAVEDREAVEESPLRMPTSTLEHFVDHLERIELVSDDLRGAAESIRGVVRVLRDVHSELIDVRRVLGPPKPWSASAQTLVRLESAARSLSLLVAEAERSGGTCRQSSERLSAGWREIRGELSEMRHTTVARLFHRISESARRFASNEGKLIRVDVAGAELSLDRSIADRLAEPLLQLVANAVSHGIETPEERVRRGKSQEGLIRMTAERQGDWLRLTIEDDGTGVDVERVRLRAVESGVVSREVAEALREHEIVDMLFAPGLSTRQDADYQAGRGVGLDLAQDVLRRLGGEIHLSTRRAGGVRAIVDLPIDRGILDVAWLEASGHRVALPVTFTGRMRRVERPSKSVSLASCLGLPPGSASAFDLEIVIAGMQPIAVSIDALGAFEEVSVRPLPPLLAAAGPYCGAVLQGDGKLCLVLDAALLAARAWSAHANLGAA